MEAEALGQVLAMVQVGLSVPGRLWVFMFSLFVCGFRGSGVHQAEHPKT